MLSRVLCWLGLHSAAPVVVRQWNEWDENRNTTVTVYKWPCCGRELNDAKANR